MPNFSFIKSDADIMFASWAHRGDFEDMAAAYAYAIDRLIGAGVSYSPDHLGNETDQRIATTWSGNRGEVYIIATDEIRDRYPHEILAGRAVHQGYVPKAAI